MFFFLQPFTDAYFTLVSFFFAKNEIMNSFEIKINTKIHSAMGDDDEKKNK